MGRYRRSFQHEHTDGYTRLRKHSGIMHVDLRTHKGGVWPKHLNAGLRNLVQLRRIFVIVLGGTGAVLGRSKLGGRIWSYRALVEAILNRILRSIIWAWSQGERFSGGSFRVDFHDFQGVKNPQKKIVYTSQKIISLSLIHISEPTRPY